MKAPLFFSLISLLAVNSPQAQESPQLDPLGELLIPPQRIFQEADRIGLTEQRRADIEAVTKQLQTRTGPLRERIHIAKEALAESLRNPEVELSETAGLIEELLDAEREGKRVHLELLIEINGLLTSEQRQQLHGVEIKTAQQLLMKDGDSARPIPELPPLLGADSPDELNSMIDAFRAPDVAWRKIPWKTCLLEGVQESRQQKKPIILWVFIDLPIDDKRC